MAKKEIFSTDRKPAIIEIKEKGLTGKRLLKAAADTVVQPARILKRKSSLDERLEALDAGLDIVINPARLLSRESKQTITKAKYFKQKSQRAKKSLKKCKK